MCRHRSPATWSPAPAGDGSGGTVSLILRLGIAAAFVAGCSPAPGPADAGGEPAEVRVDDALVQFSVLAALAAGDYADGAPLRDVLAGGDFGIGTFDRLDGEMVVLDGEMYQVRADGTVRAADLGGTTPFAAVTFFGEDGRVEGLDAATLEDLDGRLDRLLPRRNAPYAVRIDGEFADLTLRSVPAQSPPFRPLVDVVQGQAVWRLRDVRGTLVGFRCPAWVGTLNVSGYHWHFLSDDRTVGGHVLNCEFQDGSLRFDECEAVLVHIPQPGLFDEFDAGGVGQRDIDRIERQRTREGPP